MSLATWPSSLIAIALRACPKWRNVCCQVLVIFGLILPALGCTILSPRPSLEYETPFATIDITGKDISSVFAGTGFLATQDAVWVVVPGYSTVYKLDPLAKTLDDSIVVAKEWVGMYRNFLNPMYPPLIESGEAIWVRAGNEVSKIDPKKKEVVARIPFESTVLFLLSGSPSTVWVATWEPGWWWKFSPDYRLSKIDAQTNRVITTLPQEFSARYTAISAGPDALWFVDGWNETLSRLDPTSGQVVASVDLGPSSRPYGPVAVCAGAVWAASSQVGNVIRINPDTMQLSATIPLPYTNEGRRPDVVYGPPQCANGLVWVASAIPGFFIDPTFVYAIDPHTNQVVTTMTVLAYASGGFSIAIGHDALWVRMLKHVGLKKERLVIDVYRLPNLKAAAR
jgi:hypothetical protein